MTSPQNPADRRGPWLLLVGLVLTAVVWGFGPRPPQVEVEFARSAVVSLSTGNWPALRGTLGEAFASYDPQVIVEEMAELFPAETPQSIAADKVVTSSDSGGKRTTTVLLKCTYEQARPLNVTMKVVGPVGALTLDDIRVTRPAAPDAPQAEAMPKESVWKLRLTRLAFAAGAAFVFGFSVRECALCLRRSNPEGGILRALLSLVGLGGLTLDWDSGTILFWPFQILAGSAAASTSVFKSEWLISIAVPVGALYVWSQRRRRQQYDALREVAETLSTESPTP